MAKKKVKAQSKKQSSVGWIVAVVVIVVIAALILNRGKETAAPVTTEVQKEAAVEKEAWTTSTAPEFDKACKSVAVGVIPGSLNKSADNVVTFNLKNNGRVPIEGTYFEFSDGVKKAYRKNSDPIKETEILNYKVSLDDVAKELGAAVVKFTVYPVQAGKACANAALKVIK